MTKVITNCAIILRYSFFAKKSRIEIHDDFMFKAVRKITVTINEYTKTLIPEIKVVVFN